jgi:hypothetical protein
MQRSGILEGLRQVYPDSIAFHPSYVARPARRFWAQQAAPLRLGFGQLDRFIREQSPRLQLHNIANGKFQIPPIRSHRVRF